jgi:uncharacterized protein YdbL (DUF1318 family)
MNFPPPDFEEGLIRGMEEATTHEFWREKEEEGGVVRVTISNALDRVPADPHCTPHVFTRHLLADMSAKRDSVEEIARLRNSDYDALLSQNAVFLELVDASAVNTVMECIVRNTPIFVNRLPALEEVLGTDYPGFYGLLANDDDPPAMTIVSDINSYKNAHLHLLRLAHKSRFDLDNFVRLIDDAISEHAA